MSWNVDSVGLSGNDVYALAGADTIVIAGTIKGVFRSIDSGKHWAAVSNGWTASFAISGNYFFAGTLGGGVLLSTDQGESWSEINNGLTNKNVRALTVIPVADKQDSASIIAGTDVGVFRSTNNGANWTESITGLAACVVQSFAIAGTDLFVGAHPGGVFVSAIDGTSFAPANVGLQSAQGFYAFSFAVVGKDLFAGTDDGVYHSTNNGQSWISANTGFRPWTTVTAMAASGSRLFAGANGVYHSTDNGESWMIDTVGMSNRSVYALALSDTSIFAGTDRGPFFSSNNGTSWTSVNNGSMGDIRALAFCGKYLFAGGNGALFRSSDYGANWTVVNNGLTRYHSNAGINSIAVFGADIFVGSQDGVYYSTNMGENWTEVDSGLTVTLAASVAVYGSYLYAGIEGSSVWRRQLSEMLTTVNKTMIIPPRRFELAQNYPNPFNPSTTISFNLPSKSFVSLKIFDVIGRDVATIVSKEMSAGNYTREWNAANMSSGIYFYRLQAGSFTETKKLVLLR